MASFSGVIAAAVTPHGRRGDESDIGATLELIDFLCAAGVQGIALLGSTGEFVNLNFDDRVRLVYLAVKRSRVPVLAGISHSTLDGALALAREAGAAGAAGLLLMPPYFFRYRQPEIQEFYLRFAAELNHAPPIYLYNIPAFTSPIDNETAIRLLATGHFAGIKDSSGSWDYFAGLHRYKSEHPCTLLVGHDGIFARARREGADGVVSGVACAVPELLLALDRAAQQEPAEEAERLDARLHEFLARLDRFPTPVALKAALAVRGLKTGAPPVPLARETEAALDEFRAWFRAWL
ncbi:MAG TPA: dihydrodipicolinate synthase family protein [Bryobacteraceae bacterium]|nr:dihydrodipicolinate synthase family protein [Bryobacteraceae bacterium]